MVREIPLTQGKVALVDDEDYDALVGFRWFAYEDDNTWYVRRNEQKDGRRVHVLLHRQVLAAPTGVAVDHVNGDGLDCRRGNLRRATASQNAMNRRVRRDCSTGFKGVRRSPKQPGRWVASIRVSGRRMHLGSFDVVEDAAREYDRAARKHFGTFARTNFMED